MVSLNGLYVSYCIYKKKTGKVNYVWPFLYSGPPYYLHPPGLCNKGPEPLLTQPHTLTLTVINAQGFSVHSLPLSKKRPRLPSTPPSLLCCFAPSICSPVAPGERWPWEKGKMAWFCLWCLCGPVASQGAQRHWCLESCLASRSLIQWLLISYDQLLFPPRYENIQEVRIIIHVSLHDECLLNISSQSPTPPSIVSPHSRHTFDKFKEGIEDLGETNQGCSGSKREINLNESICKTINFLKPQTREIGTQPFPLWLGKAWRVCGRMARVPRASFFQLVEGWSQAVTHLVTSVHFPLADIYVYVCHVEWVHLALAE